jgi:hypothetical protein
VWVVAGLSIALIAAGVAVVVVIRRRLSGDSPSTPAASADQWFALGVIFTGAGVALTATLGPFMIWMIALGVVYLGMGARMRRDGPK